MAREKKVRWLKWQHWALLLCVCATGCTRYHLGFPVQHASFQSIYVAPAINKAFVAQAQSVLTRQVREEIIRNGHLTLLGKDEADAILEMTITHYGRSIGSVVETDPDTAKTLSLKLDVCCSLKDIKTGRYLLKNTTVSYSINISANDYAQAIEYQRLPQVTKELAKKLVLLIENIDA